MYSYFILMVYLFFFLVRPHQWDATSALASAPITAGLLMLALVLCILQEKPKQYPPQFWMLVLLSPVIILSATANGWYMNGINSLQPFILTATIPVFLFVNTVKTMRRQEILMFLCIVYAMLMLWNGISQISSETGIGWSGAPIYQGRITYLGTLRDPNDLGGFFVMCLPFAVYFATIGTNFMVKIYGMISAAFLLYGVYLTNSRGSLVAMLATMGCYVYYRYGAMKTTFMGMFSLPILLFVVSNFREIDAEDGSAVGRREAWYAGYRMLVENPLFGVGMNNFTEEHIRAAHNSFVLVMAELGLIGYGLWFSCITLSMLSLYMGLVKYRRKMVQAGFKVKTLTEEDRAYALNNTTFFSFFGFMASAFFLSRSYMLLTYILVALAISSHIRLIEYAPELKSKNLKSVISKLFALSILSIIGLNLLIKIIK